MNNLLRTLFVDDSPDDCALAAYELRREFAGMQVQQIADPSSFARALEAGEFSLVITEYQLSWTDGLTVLRAVKARWPECPVIMFTGAGSEEITVKALKAGLDDYITKSPKHVGRLRAAVREAKEQVRLRRVLKDAQARPVDMAEHQRVEEKLRKVNRALKTLSEFNQALVHATQEVDLLHKACQIIVGIGAYRLAWIGTALADENKTVRPAAYAGYEAGYLETVNISWADTERGRGPTGTAIRTGEPCICRNTLTDPHYAPWREEAIKCGYLSSIALPLVGDGRVLGVLNIYAAEQDAFDEEEVKLLAELVGDLAYGIVSLRIRAEHEQAEAALRESEEMYRTLVEASTDAIFLETLEGRVLDCNTSACQMFGYTKAELLGLTAADLVPEQIAATLPNLITQELTTGGAFVDMLNQRKDGRVFPCEVSTRLATIGGEQRVIAYVRDITERVRSNTERRQAEEALRASERKYRTLAEAARDMIFIISRQGNVEYVNSFAAEQFGRRPEEIVGRPQRELFPSEVADRQKRSMQRVFETGQPTYTETQSSFVGREAWLGTWLAPIQNEAGQVNAILGIARDITERIQAEAALRESEQRHKLVLELTSDYIFRLDIGPDGNVVMGLATENLYDITGRTIEEVRTPDAWATIFHPDDLEKAMKLLQTIVSSGQSGELECRTYLKSGRLRWVRIFARPVLDEKTPRVAAIVGAIQDITKRKQAEEALRRRDSILEAVGFAAKQFLKATTWGQNIRQVLEQLGNATQASRVYIFQSHKSPNDPSALLVSQLYEWAAPGIEAQIDSLALQSLPLRAGGFARWEDVLSQGQVIQGHIREFPASEQQVLASQNIQSIVVVPIFVGQEWWGHIGLDECMSEREWSVAEVDALKAAADILGAAIQREQAEDEIRRRLRETALLNRVIATATSTLDGKVVLYTACQELAGAFEAPQCTAAMLNKDHAHATVVAEYIAPGRSSRIGLVISLADANLITYVLEHKTPLAVVNALADPRLATLHQVLAEQHTVSLLVVPILLRGEVVGAIRLDTSERRQFSDEEIALAQSVAAATGQAWENVRLYEQARTRAEQLALLYDAGLALNRELDPRAQLEVLFETAMQALHADRAEFFRYDPVCGEVRYELGIGYKDAALDTLLNLSFHIGEERGVVGWVGGTHKPLYLPDALADPRWMAIDPKIRSGLWAPVEHESQLHGILAVLSTRVNAFTSQDEQLLALFANQAAVAMENAQLYEAAQSRARHLATLNEIGQAVTSTLELDRVLATLLEHVRQATDAAACSVALVDPYPYPPPLEESEGWGLVFRQAVGAASREVIGLRLKPGQGIAGWVAAHRQSALVLDAATDPRFYGNVSRSGAFITRDMVCVPLITRDIVIGVVELINKQAGTFNEGDIRLLESVAAHAAIAIENARLFQGERQQRELAETLSQVGAALVATLNVDTVLDRLLEQISRVVPNDAANLMLIEGDHVRIVRWRGYERFDAQDFIPTVAYLVAETLNLRQMFETGQPMAISDTTTYAGWLQIPQMKWLRSYAGAPIRVRGHVTGFLNVDSATSGFFDQSHADRLQAFADQAAIALQNARLFEAERRRSTELETLRQASLRLTSSLELQPVMETILEHALKLVTADDAHIFLYDGERLTFGAAMWAGNRQQEPFAEPRPQGITYTVARSGERMVVSDVNHHPLFQNWQWGGAIIGLPLLMGHRAQAPSQERAGRQVRGVMTIAFDKPHTFDENEIRALELLADQAAIALQNAQLFEETRRRLGELAAVSDVALGGAVGRPFDEIVASATQALSRLWPTANVGFLFVNEADQTLRLHPSYHGIKPDRIANLRIPIDKGITGWAVRERQPVRVGDVTTNHRYISGLPGMHSEMAAPLVVGNRAIGVVNVENPLPAAFSEDDLRLLTTLAGQLMTIFEKARLDAALAEHAEALERRVEERTAEIRSQQARTQAILDALGEGVIVTDVQGTILYVNPATEVLTGYSVAEAMRENPRLWKSRQTPIEVHMDMWDAILSGRTWRGEIVNMRKDGVLYNALLTIAPIFHTDSGQLAGFVGVQHDITRLKEVDRLKSEFVSNVSHELRTPLSNIKLYLSLLERGKSDAARQAQYVDVLKREEIRLEHLIEDLLTLSRIDLGRVSIQRAPLDVDMLARQLVADRQTLAAARGLALRYETQPDPLPPVLADAAMISQVLTNLTSNAVNYTPPGGIIIVRTGTYRISEESSPAKMWVSISVRDTGPGISTKDREHLFERFYRGQAARQTSAPGTGLGLAICKEIVSRHEGKITVESEPGKGSTFTVWLPAA